MLMLPRINRVIASVAALAVVASTASAPVAFAQATWDGGGADANWATAGNWVGDTLPTFNDTLDVTFNATAAGNLTNWLGNNRTIRSLTFNDDADSAVNVSFTSNGSTGARTLTMGNATDGASINVLSGAAGNISLGSGGNGQVISLAGNLVIDHAGGGTLTTRAISGSFGVTKNGAGTWSMGSRGNSFSGGLTVNAGTVTLSTGSTAGSNAFGGGLTVTGGSVTFAASSVVDFTGGLTVTGGTVSAATAATYTGDTSITNGIVQVSVDDALSSGTLTLGSGAVLRTDGTATRRTLANPVVITGDVQLGESLSRLTLSGPIDLGSSARTLTVENSTTNGNLATILSGVISGNAAITKEGAGILDITNGGNTFTGDVSLVEGTLRLSSNAMGGAANKLLVNGDGSVVVSNIGTQALTISNAVDVAANFTFGGGGSNTLTLGGAMDLGNATRTITLNGAATKTLNGVISNGGLALVVDAGTVNLGGANTYSGDTTVSGTVGVVNLTNSLALQNSTLAYAAAGGSVAFSGITEATFGGPSGDKALVLANTAAAAVDLSVGNNNASTTYSGGLSGAGSLTKVGSGTLTLGTANTYAGQTVISAGTLALGAGGSIADSVGIFLSSATTGLDVSAASGGGITIGSGKGVGGLGTITGDLSLATGAGLILSSQALIGAQPLTVTGAVSLPNDFGIASLFGTTGQPFNFGLIPDGTYTLINNASNFNNISNLGPTNAASVGGGRSAYFAEGSLNLVVVPEPSVLFLGLGVGTLAAWRLRRRGT